jgi:hypothetical protein
LAWCCSGRANAELTVIASASEAIQFLSAMKSGRTTTAMKVRPSPLAGEGFG